MWRGWWLACLLSLVSPLVAEAVVMVENGRAVATVFVKNDDHAKTLAAAGELARYLKQMTGVEVPVKSVDSAKSVEPGKPAIIVGQLARDLGLAMNQKSRALDGFRYRVAGQQLLVTGESPQGELHAVFDLLERLGCGWYAPGKVGEVIPSVKAIALADDLDHTAVSDSINRRFWYGGKGLPDKATAAWLDRNKAEHQVGSWNHAWHGLIQPKEWFASHPEYFSLNRGQRTIKQLCTTNPDTLRVAAETLMRKMADDPALIFAAGPNDGGNLCECEQCAKLDTPGYLEPTSGRPSCADRVFGFASQLAGLTSQQHPTKDLGVLVYSEYSRPPRQIERLHANVFPMIAPIRRCRFHGPGNPHCASSQLLDDEIAAWGKLTGKLGFYVYNYNLADTLVPLSKISYYKRLQQAANRANPTELAWIFETIDSWSTHAPHMYLSARIAWNSHIDIDAEMERYFKQFYGESSEPMRRYWMRIDQAYDNTPVHTGSQYGLHRIWTAELLAQSRADITEAKRLARSERVQEAVAMADAGLQCAERFMSIWNHIATCDFVAAGKAQETLKSHVAELAKHTEPNWIHDRYALGYYTRFVGLTVDAGAAALDDGGKLVARLPDEWRFQQDPTGVGTEQKWWEPTFDDRKWMPMATFSRSWADYGIGEYQGEAWYRTTFEIANPVPIGDLRLWFGGFDYNVEVYLNGQRLGGWLGFAKPAEFADIGKHLQPGKNHIAVRVAAGDLGELGTGGLLMPVMIYQWNGKSALPTGKKGVEYVQ